MKLSKLQDSIIILIALQQIMEKYLQQLLKLKDAKAEISKTAFESMILIHACSYLDEWKILGSEDKSDVKIIRLRKCTKPALKKIREWKDLELYRNNFLAHNMRDSKGLNSLSNSEFNFKIPHTLPDLVLLVGLCNIINLTLIQEFHEDYSFAIKAFKANKITLKKDGLKNFEEARKITVEIGKEIDKLLKEIV